MELSEFEDDGGFEGRSGGSGYQGDEAIEGAYMPRRAGRAVIRQALQGYRPPISLPRPTRVPSALICSLLWPIPTASFIQGIRGYTRFRQVIT